MDGYGIRGRDLPEQGIAEFKIIGTALAGKPFEGRPGPGECVSLTTGAWLPEGVDTVLIQERVERQEDRIRCDNRAKAGQNVRQAGEDIKAGEVILRAGCRLMPAELGLLASVGIGEVGVFPRPRVAYFSTGDELRATGQSLDPGSIYDSNRYTVTGMLRRLGADVIDMGAVADDPKALQRALLQAANNAEVVITSGGVSVGEADYIKPTLSKLGELQFWQVAIRPGRPLTFGKINRAYFFGLPGNPVAVMVTFYEFLQPALKYLMGERDYLPVRFKVRCESKLRKRVGRTEYQRGKLVQGEDGNPRVIKSGSQGSGILSSMTEANCFIVLPNDCESVEPGALVDVEPFYGLV
jgi:molybdopterin molybdotransferase